MGSVVFTDSYQISSYGYYTQEVRVNFSESYSSTTKKNTITLTSVDMSSGYAAGTSPVYGVVKFNGTAVKTMNGGSNQVNLANSFSVVTGSSGSSIDLNNDATSFTITLEEGNGGYFGAYVKTGTKPYRMFGVGTPANKTATVTAHYIVSYNANSGTGAPASQTKTYDVPLTLTTTKPSKATTTDATYTVTYNYNNGSSNTTATATKKTAYTFSKWNTQSNGTGTNYSSGGTYSANGSATLYAQYTSSTSTAAVTLPNPSRTGYSLNGWYTAASGGTKVGNGGASYTPTGNITLYAQWTGLASTIATISSSVATQSNLALTVTRMSSAYYHKATFKIDGTTMATSDAFATSLSYTIPRSWFTSYSSATSKTVDVSVQTYTTSACTTTVGSPATSSFTMTADSGMKPTVSSGWATFAYDNTGTAASGIAGYVKGYSKAKVTFNPSKIILNANSPGATIASYAVTCLGSTDSSSPYYTPTLTGTSVTATCKVTDSRGRYATQDFTISVMDYTKPTLSGVTVFRCNSGGTADADGANISVKATKNFSSLNGLNSCTLTAAIAPSGGSYGAATTLTSGTASVLGGNALSPDTSYTVKIIATDSLSNSATYYYTVPTRKWAMKFRTDGSGVAFGKAAEANNVFEVNPAWDVKVGNVHIERDSGDAFYYAKRTDTSVQAGIGVAASGANHGIYSYGYNDGSYHSAGKWIIYRGADGYVTADRTVFIPNVNIDVYAGETILDKIQRAISNGVIPTDRSFIGTIRSGSLYYVDGELYTSSGKLYGTVHIESFDFGSRIYTVQADAWTWRDQMRVYEETIIVSFAAGTIGTRGFQKKLDYPIPSGFKMISGLLYSLTNSSEIIPIVFCDSSNIYFNAYRATASAVSGNLVRVRAVVSNNEGSL